MKKIKEKKRKTNEKIRKGEKQNLNIIFIQGRIISDIEFKFIIKGYNYSIAIFKIILNNNSVVKVKGCNEIADYCYKNLYKTEIINI